MGSHLLPRKEGIILTVVDIINELGIQGLSTREIARRQGISDGALFKHYKTKNDILLAVLDYFAQYDSDILQSIEVLELKPKEAITYFVNAFAEYYENYPAITAIDQAYDVLFCDPALAVKVKNIYTDRTDFIQKTIEQGQKVGQICPDVDSDHLTHIVAGSFRSVCLSWRLNNYAFPLKEKILLTLKVILDAFTPSVRQQ
ncbi:TetR/AcrR family transcriptional regulator [Candidatus Formimonas warabiya]|uniref:HTH tetR-type domain-containing protein n=1 Tax=Formimonas warabiya TaxID=1761012 RepID=A0A3G1KUB6_FORW1|nr:TetR/AcrR family transcriptional regulator [Candidatus Formimonas warabiya]ATW26103.1 hypothetical protein DCMF_16165 [Candidatus Formimonas warabiya]